MSGDFELLAEIKDQLQHDILCFGWLCQLAQLANPHFNENEQISAVVDAVIRLSDDGTIIVGEAREADGIVLIDPWPERGNRLRARIGSAIDLNELDRSYCFWIQLSEHATTDHSNDSEPE